MAHLRMSLTKASLAIVLLCPAALAGEPSRDLGEAQESARQALGAAANASVRIQGQAVQAPVAKEPVERRIILFKPGTSSQRRMEIASASGAADVRDLWLINAVAVAVPQGRIHVLDESLNTLAEVQNVQPDLTRQWLLEGGAISPETPRLSIQQAQIPWGIQRVNAPQAWPYTRGAGITVCMVDTGIDATHPDLRVAGGYNAVDPSRSFSDDNGHGTHVAGILAGLGNGDGVVGVAPDVTLLSAKVLDAEGHSTDDSIIAGMQWCVEQKAQIVNMSMGSYQGYPVLEAAVKAMYQAGTLLVAAAGNGYGRQVAFPAAYPTAVAVTASDDQDGYGGFSSRGPEVSFIAPGVDILSTFMGGGYMSMTGTSMASPHVAGLAALAAARGAQGPEAIRSALISAATKIKHYVTDAQGHGMIDAAKLVGAN